jgi:acyl-CoA synthetase (AMP-forming)/AMP-acid ligase II
LDDEGRLYYRGRYSMMVKTGGENVSEIEVENFLASQVDEIRAAIVVGAPDPQWGEIVVAYVEVDHPETFDGQSVRAFAKGKLAPFKIPRKFIVVEAGGWPVTPTGKVSKPVLRERAAREVAEERMLAQPTA